MTGYVVSGPRGWSVGVTELSDRWVQRWHYKVLNLCYRLTMCVGGAMLVLEGILEVLGDRVVL